eukprot:503309-Pyramimonas_sp.AAC.1
MRMRGYTRMRRMRRMREGVTVSSTMDSRPASSWQMRVRPRPHDQGLALDCVGPRLGHRRGGDDH